MAQLNFKPAGQTNFTYCTGTSCLPCTEDGCYKAEGANPCKSFEKSALLCAFADLDGDPSKLDLWIVDKEGQTKHLKDDCP